MIHFKNYKSLRSGTLTKLARCQYNGHIAAVDQYDKQDFNLNDNGFIRNDISQLMRAQSQAEYEMKLRTLTEIPPSSLPDDVSTADAIALLTPRYAQSPAELAIFAETLARRDMVKYHDAYEKALKDVSFKKDDAVVSSTANVESKTE